MELIPAIICIINGRRTAVDVVGVTSCIGHHAAGTTADALKRAEAGKVRKYSSTLADLDYDFIPFAFDAHGSLGKGALSVLTALTLATKEVRTDLPHDFATVARRDISMAIAVGTGLHDMEGARACRVSLPPRIVV